MATSINNNIDLSALLTSINVAGASGNSSAANAQLERLFSDVAYVPNSSVGMGSPGSFNQTLSAPSLSSTSSATSGSVSSAQLQAELALLGLSPPPFGQRLNIATSQGQTLSNAVGSGQYASTPSAYSGAALPSYASAASYSPAATYAPSITPQYAGGAGNGVLNQAVASGAFSTALTPDQNNMLSQAAAAGASSSQIAMMKLQMEMENQQEVLQAISKIFNMLDQTAKAIIQNM